MMIAEELQKLGWSKDLIDAVNAVASKVNEASVSVALPKDQSGFDVQKAVDSVSISLMPFSASSTTYFVGSK